ncbi:aminobutyraldehyde dehydrogenase [Pseudoclavibacter sp. CFCC 11306]|uniref:aminobutyraldehyde dehydrogenase n=1 Tax=Pseudoclavibacter sp. CFCC 11306 TaxID=1564493 RepID=UPI001301389B|nr:aminobutyraldehyde dehydrogenase [Pseudoclavibacter sp. CFCC 11306]KAB1659207.1 aldehyde dehydrogenase family protein [Pseudoclavibacter sp. CFCC 11306]
MTANRLQNFIHGAFVNSDGERTLPIVDPASEETIATMPVSTAGDVDRAFQSAAVAQRTWGTTTPAQRQEALLAIADELYAHRDEFADLESANTGKVRASLVEDEVLPTVDHLRYFAGAARHLEGAATAEYSDRDHTSSIRREPLGVVGQITPWNYPLNMLGWKIGPALAAGDATVVKPSDTTPLTTLRLAELASAHLPAGTFNVVLGDASTGNALVGHPVPRLVSITGSVRAGREVAQTASEDLKRLHLELGGKAPVIVFADADLDRAVETLATAAFFNAGQDCTAGTRLLVEAPVHDAFVQRLVEHIERHVRTGDPRSADTFYGPVNNVNQFERLLGIFDRVPSHATVRTGGHRVGELGFFIAPTVITGVRQQDELVQEEIFGPVITVQSFRDEPEALELANGVDYALAASVWTQQHGRAVRFQRDLDFGCVWVNTHLPFVSEMPHGGFKHSGYGKDLSHYAFDEYTRVKHVMSYTGP